MSVHASLAADSTMQIKVERATHKVHSSIKSFCFMILLRFYSASYSLIIHGRYFTMPMIKPPTRHIRTVRVFTKSFFSNFRRNSKCSFVTKSPENSVKTSTCASTCGSVKPALVRVLATLCVSKTVALITNPSFILSNYSIFKRPTRRC